MQEYKIYCDHCGKQFDIREIFDNITIEMAHKWCDADLCSDCLDELYDIVYKFCNGQGE